MLGMCNILYIGDDLGITYRLSDALAPYGYDAKVCNNSDEGLETIQNLVESPIELMQLMKQIIADKRSSTTSRDL